MAGTWQQLPDNHTRDIALAYERCVRWGTSVRQTCLEWGLDVVQQCEKWADEGYNACGHWSDHGQEECCDWAPCSWFCDAFYWVAKWVCDFFVWVAKWVCIVVIMVLMLVCVLFSFVMDIFCLAYAWVIVWTPWSKANGGVALLLTDGTMLMNECQVALGTARWWRLHPDANGSYFHGLWSRCADSHVARLYFASAVLADGRVIVCGGEYSDASGPNIDDETNRCEIYDPVADTWTEIDPPQNSDGTPWRHIGDAACAVLADGRFLMGNAFDGHTAIFDPVAGTWTLVGDKTNGRSAEESWVLLVDGTVLTADCFGHPRSEKFVPSTNGWMRDADVTVDLIEDSSKEIGPGVVLQDGRAFYVGATGKTALYTAPTQPNMQGSWTAGPDLPMAGTQTLGTKDGPGCLLVNGNVLIAAAPVNGVADDYLSPTSFFEFDGTNINAAATRPHNDHPVGDGHMLLLPTGDVVHLLQDETDYYAYAGYGSPQDEWRPAIQACPTSIVPGSTIQISGTQFNGRSQAVGYGDDSSAATNYPLVRIKNRTSGHVRYCRTFNHTTTDDNGATVTSMGVGTGTRVITTNAAVPNDIEPGESDVFVVANGIESLPFAAVVSGRWTP
jgi:hypothetical protein